MRFVLLVFAFLFFPHLALAHGGGLDGYGCHHNRKAGGYHCHRGVMAGQSFDSKEQMLEAMRKQGKKPAPYGAPGETQPKR